MPSDSESVFSGGDCMLRFFLLTCNIKNTGGCPEFGTLYQVGPKSQISSNFGYKSQFTSVFLRFSQFFLGVSRERGRKYGSQKFSVTVGQNSIENLPKNGIIGKQK